MESINIKGKEYIPVNERIKEFWRLYPNGRIATEIIGGEEGMVIMKASIYKDITDEKPSATGIAFERESSSFINKTSYIENCETSAVGRALGIVGIGIDVSLASAEELENALENQKKIDTIKVQALEKAISNRNIEDYKVDEILNKFGYKAIVDILVTDYKKICDELSKEAK